MLDLKTASTIATSIVHAKLDYCNSLFLNIDITQINRLQAIQNALARAASITPKHHHITHVLKNPTGSKYLNESNTTQYYSPISSILSALLSQSAVHCPTFSFNAFLFRPNTAPPFCHLVTQIC